MNKEILKDHEGKNSSKRIAGFIISITGLILLVAIGVCAMFFEIKDPETSLSAFKAILIVGGGLLGISVFEFFKGKK